MKIVLYLPVLPFFFSFYFKETELRALRFKACGRVPDISSMTVRSMKGQVPLLCLSYWDHRQGGVIKGLIGFLVPFPVLIGGCSSVHESLELEEFTANLRTG